MGKAYAPSLGNIYLLDFDKYLMQGLDGCIPSLPYRFLDDVFFIWLGDIQSLQRFVIHLNTITPGITVTLKHHTSFIDFLDVTIFKSRALQHTYLLRKVYFKPTDTHCLIHAYSNYPPHTMKGIVKAQITRYHRLSSLYIDFHYSCSVS